MTLKVQVNFEGRYEHSCRNLPIQYLLLYWSMMRQNIWAPFYYHGLTLIPAWISNYIHYNVWDEITYPILNFNGATVEV